MTTVVQAAPGGRPAMGTRYPREVRIPKGKSMLDVNIFGSQSFPALDEPFLDVPNLGKLTPECVSTHPARILLLYGSLRERSSSRFLTERSEEHTSELPSL